MPNGENGACETHGEAAEAARWDGERAQPLLEPLLLHADRRRVLLLAILTPALIVLGLPARRPRRREARIGRRCGERHKVGALCACEAHGPEDFILDCAERMRRDKGDESPSGVPRGRRVAKVSAAQ